MARKAGQGKEEEESRARQQEEKTPVRDEEKKPACHGGGHHVVEQVSKSQACLIITQLVCQALIWREQEVYLTGLLCTLEDCSVGFYWMLNRHPLKKQKQGTNKQKESKIKTDEQQKGIGSSGSFRILPDPSGSFRIPRPELQ
ncbi:hypothetical protein STEG23_020281 [Scotinomys teguina]